MVKNNLKGVIMRGIEIIIVVIAMLICSILFIQNIMLEEGSGRDENITLSIL